MINKAGVYENMQICNSRLRAMSESADPGERANAELYRLAVQEWQDVALKIGKHDFDPQSHLDQILSRWRRYVATGIAYDSVDNLQTTELAKFIAEDRRRRGIEPEQPSKHKKPRQTPAEISPDDPRHFLDSKAVEGLLNEFRKAFDMPMVDYGS